MAYEFNGSTQYFSVGSTLLTDEPITLLAHGNSDSATVAQAALSLGNNGANGYYFLQWQGNVASDPIRGSKANDAGSTANVDSIGYTADAWHIGAVSFVTNTSRKSFINGGTKGSNTTSITDPTPDFITVGALRTGAVANYFDGELAQSCFLNVDMTDAQHGYVGKGIAPHWYIPIKNIRGYFPLISGGMNRMASGYPDLTATNSPTRTPNPPKVMYPKINGRMFI